MKLCIEVEVPDHYNRGLLAEKLRNAGIAAAVHTANEGVPEVDCELFDLDYGVTLFRPE